jgi:hypothetical protein
MAAALVLLDAIKKGKGAEKDSKDELVVILESVLHGRMSSRLLEEIFAELAAKRPQTLAERAAIDAAIGAVVRGILESGGQPTIPTSSSPSPTASQQVESRSAEPAPSPPGLAKDSPFYGLSLRDAAHKYLTLCAPKDAKTAREIWEALAVAGFQSAHSEPASAVHHALSRRASKADDVLLVGGGMWGLKHWYLERELDEIKKSVGGMGGRDRAAHSERTKRGMLVARRRGVRLGKKLFFTKEREAEFERRFKAGETVAGIAKSWGKTTTIIRARYNRAALRALRDQARRETEHEVAGETRH